MKLFILTSLLVLIYSCNVFAVGEIHLWTNDSLGQTLNSEYEGDTIRFVGTSISTTGTGVTIQARAVVFDGRDGSNPGDTMFFGTGGGDNVQGIIVGTSGNNFTMLNIWLIHLSGLLSDTSSTADIIEALEIQQVDTVTMDGGGIKVFGTNANCVSSFRDGTVCTNITLKNAEFWNYSYAYDSRTDYGGAAIRIESRPDSADYGVNGFALHVDSITVHKAPHSAIVCIGRGNEAFNQAIGLVITNSTLNVDARNTFYSFPPGKPVGQSSTNAYCIITAGVRATANQPVRIGNNTLQSGTDFSGSRGILLDNSRGVLSSQFTIDSNTMVLHNGPDAENLNGVIRGIRLRSIDAGGWWDYVNIFDNTLEVFTDTIDATTHIGEDASSLQFSAFPLDTNGGHLTIDNNMVTARALSGGCDITVAECHTDPLFDSVLEKISITNNTFIGSGNVVRTADKSNVGSGHDITFDQCLLSGLPAGDSGTTFEFRTWFIGYNTEDGLGSNALNCTYADGASDTNIVLWTSIIDNGTDQDFKLNSTLTVVVKGNNGLLVADADVWGVNDYGDSVLLGTSGSTGKLSGVVSYWYEANAAFNVDSLVFNDFILGAQKSGDSSFNLSFTVGSLESEKNDTLTLASTAGTISVGSRKRLKGLRL